MKSKRRKIKKWQIISIVTAILVFIATASLIITNFFIPVKYLSAYFVSANKNEKEVMRVSFIDVGYGDCTVIEFPDGKTALVDAGDGSRSSEIKVLKELNRRGIDTVDYLVCTSVRRERCGGLTEIIKYKKVNKVFAPYCPVTYVNEGYRKFSEILSDKNLEVNYCEYGNGIRGDGYLMCFLSPSNHLTEGGETDKFLSDPTSENMRDASAVLWVEYGGTGILLTGDIGSGVSDKLCAACSLGFEMNGNYIDASVCKIMKVPCNGSKSGANVKLYETFKPETAVLSVGENGLALPSVNAVADAQNFVKDKFYRTDADGTITVTVKKSGYSVQKEKV